MYTSSDVNTLALFYTFPGAFSIPALWCRIFQSYIFLSCIFSVPFQWCIGYVDISWRSAGRGRQTRDGLE